MFGKEPSKIIVPYNKEQLNVLLLLNEDWQIAIGNYPGQILHHLPASPLLSFLLRHPVIFQERCQVSPIEGAMLVFTDGSSNGKAAIVTQTSKRVLNTGETSAQKAELTAVIEVFKEFSDHVFNLFSDSQYVVRFFPQIEMAVLPENKTTIFRLLSTLQQQIWKR